MMVSTKVFLLACFAFLSFAGFAWNLAMWSLLTGLAVLIIAVLYLHRCAWPERLPPRGKSVFITGCDSGFGNATAKHLDALGIQVFAGCLFPGGEGASRLRAECSDKLCVIPLDVTEQEDVDAAIATITKSTGDEGLWGVVNNAGICLWSRLEVTPMETIQQHLDVNLLGQIRIVKATLPLLRKSRGRVISINSTNSYFYMTLFGAYGISKAAAEMFSNVLRLESRKWGIQVITIHPGGFRTGLVTNLNSMRQYLQKCNDQLSADLKQYYTPEYFQAMLDNNGASTLPTDLSPVCRTVTTALLERAPSTCYRCGPFAGVMVRSAQFLPTPLFEFFVRNSKLFNKELKVLIRIRSKMTVNSRSLAFLRYR
ncbi:estradiol 17-beta-dehydrogenase 2-like [Acanthaster planci]|uniref:Estradiol 17-beta-dehydrogenase 2-like n=1 Tax=Acanthaster planci TaxID=133434 RepID=A0A8B7ZVP9_ACAPL|nr:estradiol 17-beta-dehydrogenase 2-like [Acanthaster planci]